MLQPWYVLQRPLQGRTGSSIFQALYGLPNAGRYQKISDQWQTLAVLLESPYPLPPDLPQSRVARYSLCAGPPRYQGGRLQLWTPSVGEILPMLSARLSTEKPAFMLLDDTGQPLEVSLGPFSGGWFGWLGYDLAWEIERLPTLKRDPLPFPVAFWYEPETFVVLDHHQQQLWLAATDPRSLEIMATVLATANLGEPETSVFMATNLIFGSSQATYESAVQQAQRYIEAGDIFQANLSLRFSTQTEADSWSIYRRLQTINPSPFASYWRTPWGALISCSPERLVSLQGDRAETRPIAGTRSRGGTSQQDQSLAADLCTDAKERAEHIMLVDLERNDLGRVCTWGTVHVDEFMTLEPYSHVMHLVSNIVGNLAPRKNAIALIQAVFPGGTITGCPKVRCMEIIELLEPVRRNLFYGSCGYLDYRGNLDLNILIRTLLWTRGQTSDMSVVSGQVGAGIVADSQPQQEWHESLQKAKAQLLAMGMNVELLENDFPLLHKCYV